MTHENFHELLALRLYGELSADEARALERHLGACAECAAFALELERGLGVLARLDRARLLELPDDWAERLGAATRPTHLQRWVRALVPFAAGVAASLLVMALRPSATPSGELPGARPGAEAPFVPRSDPPPLASSRGELARLETLIRR